MLGLNHISNKLAKPWRAPISPPEKQTNFYLSRTIVQPFFHKKKTNGVSSPGIEQVREISEKFIIGNASVSLVSTTVSRQVASVKHGKFSIDFSIPTQLDVFLRQVGI